jgi:hypothetical protein
MRHSRLALCLAGFAALLLLGGVGLAQEKPKAAASQGAPAGTPPMPAPGPEHAVLKLDEGTWDATVEMFMAPGAPPMTSKGVETSTLGCGGLCLITDFKGESMGMPFLGHGVATYDAVKKKYTGTWMDSMSLGLFSSESTYDAGKKVLTGTMEGPDMMTRQTTRMKSVVEWKGADTRVFTLSGPGPDGKEMVGLRITYKRRK